MSQLTKAQKAEVKEQRGRAKKKAEKLQLQGFMYAGALGFAAGFAESAGLGFVTEGFGPLKFSHLQAIAGFYLSKKGGDQGEFGEVLATVGIYDSAKDFGRDFSLGGLFGGE